MILIEPKPHREKIFCNNSIFAVKLCIFNRFSANYFYLSKLLYGIVAAVCCFLCYFMAHEHLLKEHIYLHVASGDTPILEYRRLRSYISKLVTSRFFQKWCSRGVVSALLLQRTTDFTGFFRTFRDIAVADEKHSYHILKSS